jgi:hypothetical protein
MRPHVPITQIQCLLTFIRSISFTHSPTPSIPDYLKSTAGAWDVAQWYSAYLACMRPWVQGPVSQKNKGRNTLRLIDLEKKLKINCWIS